MAIMNENKGVFGLNMLHWWDREGSIEPGDRPALRGPRGRAGSMPVVAESFPFDRAARRPPLHPRAPQRRQGRARAMTAA